MDTKVAVTNAHFSAMLDYTKTMVDNKLIRPIDAPAFMVEFSDAVTALVEKFQAKAETSHLPQVSVAEMNAAETVKSDVAETSKTAKPPVKRHRAKHAAVIEVVKRGPGRPRKADVLRADYKENKALQKADREFRKKHPRLPGITIKNSVQSDGIILMMEGTKKVMIKRYLRAEYNISFEDYKRIYNLPDDYPSAAGSYTEARREKALEIGLGRHGKTAEVIQIAEAQVAHDQAA